MRDRGKRGVSEVQKMLSLEAMRLQSVQYKLIFHNYV